VKRAYMLQSIWPPSLILAKPKSSYGVTTP
jgi:hypothetical protein